MVNGAVDPRPASYDFRFECGDPRGQFLDRERVEVLHDQAGQRIAAAMAGNFIDIHCTATLTLSPVMSITPPDRGTTMATRAVMRAIDPVGPGGPEVLTIVERPVPVPEPGEVLIRVAAAGVNRPDVLQRKGGYPPPPGAPSIPGLEVSGHVAAAGADVDDVILGQPVCALLAGGGYAEYVAVAAGQCLPIPDGLSMVDAAALPETLFTVWTNLFERAYASEGDTVLVHGGTSGIGTMAILLGKLFGLTIIVTVGSAAKVQAALDLGAAHAINYREEDFVERVRALTDGKGVQVVIDMVGGDYVPRNLQCLADDGRHVSIAVQGGASATVPLFEIMRRRLTLTGSTLRPRDAAFKEMVADELSRTVWPHVEAGRLRAVIDRTFPLEEAAAAHARMEAGDHIGKIVLVVQPD